MGEIIDVTSLEWQPVRPDVAESVFGKTLLADGVKIVLTRVEPGGKFSVHRDDYDHLFYFFSGQGVVLVGERQFEARPGLVVRIEAGESHAYENTGTKDLVLLSVNLPVNKSGRRKE